MLLNYADNFLLLATGSQALSEGIDKLTAAVGKLPAGKFKLKVQSQGKANDGFDFLGHHLQLLQDKVQIEPSLGNWEAITERGNKMSKNVQAAAQNKNLAAALHHVEAYCAKVNGWVVAFAACDNIEEYRSSLEALIEQNACPLKVNAKELIQAATSNYQYCSGEYEYV